MTRPLEATRRPCASGCIAFLLALGVGTPSCTGSDSSKGDPSSAGAGGVGGDAGHPGGDGGDAGTAGSGAGDAGSVPGVSLATYCEQTSDRYFTWLSLCYGTEAYPEARRTEYVERFGGRCLHSEAAVAAGRLGYDDVQAARCLAATETLHCVGQFLHDADCKGIFQGLVDTGDECYREDGLVFLVGVSSCADGYCVEDDQCPGRCAAWAPRNGSCEVTPCGPDDYCDGSGICQPRPTDGAPCPSGVCAQGLVCFGDETPSCVEPVSDPNAACDDIRPCAGPSVCIDGTCSVTSALGKPCAYHLMCPTGTLCMMLPGADQSICLEPQLEGEPCADDSQCEAGLICDPGADPGTCQVDPFVPPALDAPCDDGRCAEGHWCQYDDASPDGICRAVGGVGANCAYFNTPDYLGCEDGLFCVETLTCAPPGGLGEPCGVFESGSCEGGLWCSRSTGQCTAPATEGQTCNPLWESTCGEGLGCDCGAESTDVCGGTSREPNPTDTCQPLVPDGGLCYRDAECASRSCTIDFNAAPANPGECTSQPEPCLP
jgi:hypothetical protein